MNTTDPMTQDATAHNADALRPALETHGVSKNFGGLQVLKSVTFQVAPSTIFGVAGPNGAGKTTLLNIITGFERPSGGRITVNGTDTTGFDARRVSNCRVARTFQNIRLFRGLSVREQVITGTYKHRKASIFASAACLPIDRADRRYAEETADDALKVVGLAAVGDRLAETLSYGDQRRLEIARALATRPQLLLLDEPTAGMNYVDWLPIARLLDRLRDDGMTIVVVEHNMRLLEESCDWIAVIAAGTVIAEDRPAACLRQPDVRRAYFGR